MNDEDFYHIKQYTMYALAVILILGAGLIGFFYFLNKVQSKAEATPHQNTIRAIVGEAENQGIQGMRAVACGINNRSGSLSGVFGLNNGRYDKASDKIKQQAIEAYRWAQNEGLCYELIKGANFWENIDAFGSPKNWPPVKFITKIGDHSFYRTIKGGK